MKSKKCTIKISLVLFFIAVILIVVSYSICNYRTASIFNGLGFGILGSAFVTFAVSIGEYSNIKRTSLENYYSEAYGLMADLKKILYCICDEENDLLVAFDAECKSNDRWKEFNITKMSQKDTAKKALVGFYQRNNLISNENTEQQIRAIINTRKKIAFERIEKTIDSYISASKISLKGLENAYGMIDYFTSRGNSKHRNWIYQNIHTKIRNSLQIILESCYYFEKYKKGESKDNFTVVYDQLKKVNEIFFSEETFEKEKNGFNIYKVTANVVSDLDRSLEELRYNIYKDNLEVVEPTIILISRINMEVDKID